MRPSAEVAVVQRSQFLSELWRAIIDPCHDVLTCPRRWWGRDFEQTRSRPTDGQFFSAIPKKPPNALYKKVATASSALAECCCDSILERLLPADWQRAAELSLQNCQIRKGARTGSQRLNRVKGTLLKSGGATIRLEQPAEPTFALKLVHAVDQRRPVMGIGSDQPVSNSLMGSAIVVVVDELAHDMVEVRQAENDEVIERFVLQTLNPPLDERIQVGRPRTDRFDGDAAFLEGSLKVGVYLPSWSRISVSRCRFSRST